MFGSRAATNDHFSLSSSSLPSPFQCDHRETPGGGQFRINFRDKHARRIVLPSAAHRVRGLGLCDHSGHPAAVRGLRELLHSPRGNLRVPWTAECVPSTSQPKDENLRRRRVKKKKKKLFSRVGVLIPQRIILYPFVDRKLEYWKVNERRMNIVL